MTYRLDTAASDFAASFEALVSARREVDADVDDAVAEIIAGIRKRGDVALLEQDYVIDPSKKIKDVLPNATVKSFHRWAVGETGTE